MDIDGKAIADKILTSLKEEIVKHQYTPSLTVCLIGDDDAQATYVRMKVNACARLGIESKVHRFEETITQEELLSHIEDWNKDAKIDGILIQLPLPPHLCEKTTIEALDPHKDVDGLHPINAGKLLLQDPTGFIPCTPAGIVELLEAENIETSGKHIVILGRSLLVGRPLSILLSQKRPYGDASVTVLHSKSHNINSICQTADILIAAVGRANFVQPAMVKEDAIVIDVGIHNQEGFIVGDVNYAAVSKKAAKITPVPGGVGPMTIAQLMQNTMQAHKQRNN